MLPPRSSQSLRIADDFPVEEVARLFGRRRGRDAAAIADGGIFFFGASGSGVGFHQHTAAVNFLVSGRKKWWLLPPHSHFGPDNVPAKQWEEHYLPQLLAAGKVVYEVVQEPAEVVFVPSAWMHCTINLADDTAGVALEVGADPGLLDEIWPVAVSQWGEKK